MCELPVCELLLLFFQPPNATLLCLLHHPFLVMFTYKALLDKTDTQTLCSRGAWEEVYHPVSKIFCSCMQDHCLGH